MLDHVSIAVSDISRATPFYDEVLRPLGYVRVWSVKGAAGCARPGDSDEPFALKEQHDSVMTNERFHVAFKAPSKHSVSEFHSAAIRLGARNAGGFGLHPEYGPRYYAAFVIDLDGNRIEAVHRPAADVEFSELVGVASAKAESDDLKRTDEITLPGPTG